MAPLYDTLTTRVFPGLESDHMALKLAGKDDRLRLVDFEALARTIELPLERARTITSGLVSSLIACIDEIAVPPLTDRSAEAIVRAVRTLVRERCAAMAPDA